MLPRPMRHLACSLLLPFLAACASQTATPSASGDAPCPDQTPVEVDAGAGGVIFPATRVAQVRWLGLEQPAGAWTPTVAEVAQLERLLPAALQRGVEAPESLGGASRPDWLRSEIPQILAHLPEYRRQYVGLVDAQGQRTILVRAFAGPGVDGSFPNEDWLQNLVIVDDGGFWYWQIEFDPKTGRFARFDSNGYA
ncbi:MAG TPA: hypothetical protein P5218_07275 [Planctomycetota bacterium]|nr:hypothetical protein [Planctomycetota bacterium]